VTFNRVYTHLSGISFHYRRKGKTSPCDSPRIKMYMKGLKRVQSLKPVKRAKPMTVAILKKAIKSLNSESNLISWRTIWRMCIAFFGFLRWDDISRLKVKHLQHVKSKEPYYRLKLVGGKTNQLNLPDHRVITKTGGVLCPYRLTTRLVF